jgi:hypothetical protein
VRTLLLKLSRAILTLSALIATRDTSAATLMAGADSSRTDMHESNRGMFAPLRQPTSVLMSDSSVLRYLSPALSRAERAYMYPKLAEIPERYRQSVLSGGPG